MKTDGGPAYPVPANVVFDHIGPGKPVPLTGMSLRDWFAGQALAGISGHLSGPEVRADETASQAHARWSYVVADAMLAERKK